MLVIVMSLLLGAGIILCQNRGIPPLYAERVGRKKQSFASDATLMELMRKNREEKEKEREEMLKEDTTKETEKETERKTEAMKKTEKEMELPPQLTEVLKMMKGKDNNYQTLRTIQQHQERPLLRHRLTMDRLNRMPCRSVMTKAPTKFEAIRAEIPAEKVEEKKPEKKEVEEKPKVEEAKKEEKKEEPKKEEKETKKEKEEKKEEEKKKDGKVKKEEKVEAPKEQEKKEKSASEKKKKPEEKKKESLKEKKDASKKKSNKSLKKVEVGNKDNKADKKPSIPSASDLPQLDVTKSDMEPTPDGKKGANENAKGASDVVEAPNNPYKNSIVADKPRLEFVVAGGTQVLRLPNKSDVKMGIKLKMSNNKLFTVIPVFNSCDAGKSCEVVVRRLAGAAPPKPDKVVVEWTPLGEGEKDVAAVFKKKGALVAKMELNAVVL